MLSTLRGSREAGFPDWSAGGAVLEPLPAAMGGCPSRGRKAWSGARVVTVDLTGGRTEVGLISTLRGHGPTQVEE